MVVPETNPETGHPIGCTCDNCAEYFELTHLKRALKEDSLDG